MKSILNDRFLCWDLEMSEYAHGVNIARHKPTRRGVALVCDSKWEGRTCGYPSVMKVGDKYRFYYRASGSDELSGEVFCIAESDDGVNFYKPSLGLYEIGGSRENNVFHMEERFIDNFTVHYDENPDCPADEKFKALSLVASNNFYTTELALYTSRDGISFKFERILPIKGVFDTHNVLLWDKKERMYRIYLRDFHNADGSDATYEPTAAMEKCVRDVRLSTSPDLVRWTHPVRIEFDEGVPDLELYTNQIIKYPRADIYLGMPTRYMNRRDEPASFKYLSDTDGWRSALLEKKSRIGSSVTDCVLMYSHDGLHFHRDDNAFLSPGYEKNRNWYYGDCYVTHGIVETVSDENPEVSEYSFYTGEGYRQRPIEFVRFTVRLDGFYSWRADYSGGEILTKPMKVGGTLKINFRTSALGGIRVRVCDKAGVPIEGYDSGVLFGNSTERPVDFERELSDLVDEVRLHFEMRDCDLYSFICE